MNIKRALIIDEPWISLILSGQKPWEMRTRPTKIRERIGLIRKGTGLVVGEVDLVDCLEFNHRSALNIKVDKHRVLDSSLLVKWNVAWVLKNVQRYAIPVPSGQKPGAVIWVKLK